MLIANCCLTKLEPGVIGDDHTMAVVDADPISEAEFLDVVVQVDDSDQNR